MHAWGSAIVRIKAFTGCRTSGYRQNPEKPRQCVVFLVFLPPKNKRQETEKYEFCITVNTLLQARPQ